jgi:hypothetical protein
MKASRVLDEQVRRSQQRNGRNGGLGFEQVIIGQHGTWKADRAGLCLQCRKRFERGQVAFVHGARDVALHADCVVGMADAVTFSSRTEAMMAEERQRIIEQGAFYG